MGSNTYRASEEVDLPVSIAIHDSQNRLCCSCALEFILILSSSRDLLELKEIQRSLPRANQPCDLITGRPGRHYLSAVPIGLLPLLAESDDSAQSSQNSSVAPSPVTSPRSSSPTFPSTQHYTGPPSITSEPSTLVSPWAINFRRQPPPPPRIPASAYKGGAHLAHLLPSRGPTERQQKPRFAFLPLLDTPPSSGNNSPYPSNPPTRTPSPQPSEQDGDLTSDTDHSLDPPTPSLTNASLDSSPHSRASSCSPEPPFFQLPPPKAAGIMKRSPLIGAHDSYFPPQDEHAPLSHLPLHGPTNGIRLHALQSPSLLPPSPLALEVPIVAPKPRPAKKRNFILVNDIEIELDDDDADGDVDEPEESSNKSSVAGVVSSTLTVQDTALSETNAKTSIPSSNPTTKRESAWSEPQPFAPEPMTTPTPSPPRTPKSSTRTSSMSPPSSPSPRQFNKNSTQHHHQTHWSRPLSPPTVSPHPNLHIPVVFKRGQPRERDGRTPPIGVTGGAGGGSH